MGVEEVGGGGGVCVCVCVLRREGGWLSGGLSGDSCASRRKNTAAEAFPLRRLEVNRRAE